ncbi:MAG: alkyl sulfatase dimerization domain-containing protein [Acidimicrobiales bacterium]
MSELIELSSRMIDSGVLSEKPNRISFELSEVAEGLSVVEAFSHIWSIDTGDGLVLVDASGSLSGTRCIDAIRDWRRDRVHTIVYTHGHADHVGGSPAILADAAARGHEAPAVAAHTAVHDRFARYRETAGWNLAINSRQFGGTKPDPDFMGVGTGRYLPDDVAVPTITHDSGMDLTIGDVTLELHHAKGETDDHTWLWDAARKAVYVGDLFMWNFPNAGNPQKVQRFAGDWATALRAMIAKGPELLLPAHGLPVAGADRVAMVLDTTSSALEYLVEATVSLMNEGATLDTILHSVVLPDRYRDLPYLAPTYDEPEFVVRNIYRLCGGWWDGDPSTLHPAPRSALAAEVAALSGGAPTLAARAAALVETGELELAGHLIEMAAAAAPDDRAVHEIRIAVYGARRAAATSLMAKGIYSSALNASREFLEDDADSR